jgi:hypothetical protein
MKLKKTRFVFLMLFSCLCVLFVCIALFTNGTVDSGDSIGHYLISRYAWKHPVLFFDLWNKPLFTLLSSPFAQFGFTGIKIFNALTACVSAFFVYKIAHRYSEKYSWLALVLFAGSTFHLFILNSGLTEPLFDCVLIASIWLLLNDHKKVACILFSLLPFVRQEGYPILLFLFLFLLFRREYRLLIFLFVGHVLVSCAGVFYYHDLLWVFKNNPNAALGHYGQGGWFDYFHKLAFVFGKVLYLFLAIGIFATALHFFKSKTKWTFLLSVERLPLYFFLLIVCSHTLFWRFGLFKSFGMERNLITIYSCGIVLAFMGISSILERVKLPARQIIYSVLISLVVLVYPLIPGQYKMTLDKDFSLQEDQLLIQQVCTEVSPLLNDRIIYTTHPQVVFELNLDPLDSLRHQSIYQMPWKNKKEKSIVIWDNLMARIESGVSEETLKSDTTMHLVKAYERGKYKVVVFVSN